jgi:CheY-like chemotaxis protein
MLQHILLVEDDPKDLELCLLALQKTNLCNEVHGVQGGSEALDYLLCTGAYSNRQKVNPIVIFLDLKMQKVDGFDVLRCVRTTPHLKNIPVVILTSSKEEKDVLSCYEFGANAYVVKPMGFQELIECIGKLGMFWGIINQSPP